MIKFMHAVLLSIIFSLSAYSKTNYSASMSLEKAYIGVGYDVSVTKPFILAGIKIYKVKSKKSGVYMEWKQIHFPEYKADSIVYMDATTNVLRTVYKVLHSDAVRFIMGTGFKTTEAKTIVSRNSGKYSMIVKYKYYNFVVGAEYPVFSKVLVRFAYEYNRPMQEMLSDSSFTIGLVYGF